MDWEERKAAQKFCAKLGICGVGGNRLYRLVSGGEPVPLTIGETAEIQAQWNAYWAPIEQEKIELAKHREANKEERLIKERAARAEKMAAAWPLHKQRRSNIDWASLLPRDARAVAVRQVTYERLQTVRKMAEAGITLERIGECFGVCKERARQMREKAKRLTKSPVELYFGERNLRACLYEDGLRKRHAPMIMKPFTPSRDWLFV